MQNKDIRTLLHMFSEGISAIDELDYGDFMRKATHYLNELDERIYESCSPEVQKHLDELKLDIQYYPNWDIDSTREKALTEIKRIESMLPEQ